LSSSPPGTRVSEVSAAGLATCGDQQCPAETRQYRVLLEPDEHGAVHAFAPERGPAFTRSATREEALEQVESG
jgi:hypothetical protein